MRILTVVVGAVFLVLPGYQISQQGRLSASRHQRGLVRHNQRRCFGLEFSPRDFWKSIPTDKPLGVPTRIEFSDSTMDPPWRAALVFHAVPGPARTLARWRSAAGDSIEVIIPTISWAVGARLLISSEGDTLRGTARAYLDVPSKHRIGARVLAPHLSCSGDG